MEQLINDNQEIYNYVQENNEISLLSELDKEVKFTLKLSDKIRYVSLLNGEADHLNAFIEIQWYIFDLVFLLGSPYALKHNEHVRVDIFYTKWSPKRKALANLIGTIFFLIPFSIIVVVVSWGAVLNSWAILETSPDPGGLPRYPIKTMIILSFIYFLSPLRMYV